MGNSKTSTVDEENVAGNNDKKAKTSLQLYDTHNWNKDTVVSSMVPNSAEH